MARFDHDLPPQTNYNFRVIVLQTRLFPHGLVSKMYSLLYGQSLSRTVTENLLVFEDQNLQKYYHNIFDTLIYSMCVELKIIRWAINKRHNAPFVIG